MMEAGGLEIDELGLMYPRRSWWGDWVATGWIGEGRAGLIRLGIET